MKIEKEGEEILKQFSKTLKSIDSLEETHYITDNVNLTREDVAHVHDPEKILKNAKTNKEGNITVKKADWVN
ncbi:MAG: Asp-tRNA(Asn) amidotransferase subunit GatC [Methanobrevibacter sp.]|jgi:aspartyl-tRNA(Asn)/glutamyl-tRNA(Gln) amidotransferase subunit C|nr:Asp-tRNA(Asn) amidotransferase subunit GatC [Candidatus Methanovirga aequatorialis]